MMDRRTPSPSSIGAIIALVATYILLSSWFGLTGWPIGLPGPVDDPSSLSEAGEFFVDVWRDSFTADVVFIVGTAVVAVATWWGALALMQLRRVLAWLGASALPIAAMLGNWLVYTWSFQMLSEDMRGGEDPVAATFGESARFVRMWGGHGLALTAFATFAFIGFLALKVRAPATQIDADEQSDLFGPMNSTGRTLLDWTVLVVALVTVIFAFFPWGYQTDDPTDSATGMTLPGGIAVFIIGLVMLAGLALRPPLTRAGLTMTLASTGLAAVLASVPGESDIRLTGAFWATTFLLVANVILSFIALSSVNQRSEFRHGNAIEEDDAGA